MEPTGPKRSPAEEPQFRASDVRDAAGLSYRQLNDWEAKGALPHQSDREAGWRKFSPREVFAIMVCAELRKRFGASLESLNFIKSCMLREGADHLQWAVGRMSMGLTLWLLTDFEEVFDMDHDLEFEDLFHLGYFRGDEPRGYVFLKINPIVNRLLSTLKEPIELKTQDGFYDRLLESRSRFHARSLKEMTLLQLVRDGAYKRVTVELENGEIVSASTESEHAGRGREVSAAQILKILESEPFQTVTLKTHDGKVVRVQQAIPHPLKGPVKRPPSKRGPSTLQREPDRRGGKR